MIKPSNKPVFLQKKNEYTPKSLLDFVEFIAFNKIQAGFNVKSKCKTVTFRFMNALSSRYVSNIPYLEGKTTVINVDVDTFHLLTTIEKRFTVHCIIIAPYCKDKHFGYIKPLIKFYYYSGQLVEARTVWQLIKAEWTSQPFLPDSYKQTIDLMEKEIKKWEKHRVKSWKKYKHEVSLRKG